MPDYPSFHVLIVAAGVGTRIGSSTPKQYLQLAGKPLIRHSLELFSSMRGVASLRAIIHPDHEDFYFSATKGLELFSPVIGGASRKESVFNGLCSLPSSAERDIVLIHDAARPFVQIDDIEALLKAVDEGAEAATLARPVADTVLYSKALEGRFWHGEAASREALWSVQTPQAFRVNVIKRAHQEFPADREATDDGGLVRFSGGEVRLVRGSSLNFKVTYQEDMAIAERIHVGLNLMETRTGTGFDVHAFAEVEESPAVIRLCGVDIPFNRRLAGHSDADVGLHALTDALLGALGEADIGTHFPPSNQDFKGMDSAVFLQHAAKILHDRGGYLVNADLTLICESPKIGPHREAIVARIAEILEVSPQRINVKATTTEGLGFTGRREGIAAQAAVNIALPCPSNRNFREG